MALSCVFFLCRGYYKCNTETQVFVLMYASLDISLTYAVGLVVFCIMWSVSYALAYLFSPQSKGVKQVASSQLVISFFDFLTNFIIV